MPADFWKRGALLQKSAGKNDACELGRPLSFLGHAGVLACAGRAVSAGAVPGCLSLLPPFQAPPPVTFIREAVCHTGVAGRVAPTAVTTRIFVGVTTTDVDAEVAPAVPTPDGRAEATMRLL